MSSGVLRGKESSNRIELSRLVQDLLNFGVLGSLWLWGWGVGGCGWGWVDVGGGWVDVGGGGWMWVGGGWGGTCAHVHMHTHACTHMHTHIHIKHDNFNCKWQPPLGEFLGILYDVICVHACMHACVCVHMCGELPLTTLHPIHLPPPHSRGTPRISQNSIALELIKIFRFCLKI